MESQLFTCIHCNKGFRREQTLLSHVCEPKRRWNQRHEIPVKIAYDMYLKFYAKQNDRSKNSGDFIKSPYYNQFVQFGRFVKNINCFDIPDYSNWLLQNNVIGTEWGKDSTYNRWLKNKLYVEDFSDAIKRSLGTTVIWSNINKAKPNHYFLYSSVPYVIRDIMNGQMSPWMIYNCGTGIKWLEKVNETEIKSIWQIVNPDYWSKVFLNQKDNTTLIKRLLADGDY